MTDEKMDELAGRIDGVARALMIFIAQQEDQGAFDGERYTESLRRYAQQRGQAGFGVCAFVLEQVAGEVDSAREYRSSLRHRKIQTDLEGRG